MYRENVREKKVKKVRMHSYIISEDKKYRYKFTDSPYSFDEDLEFTLEHYCSINEISSSNLEELLFSIHSHVCELRNNSTDEKILETYNLNHYGHGPNYEDNELYFLLGGDYFLDSSDDNYLIFISNDKMSTLGIYKQEMGFFTDEESFKIKRGVKLSFDGTNVFVNENNLSTLLNILIEDIIRLNNLFRELMMEEKCISVF